MRQRTEIPCAQSEPLNVEDAVISALHWRAGELLECSQDSEQSPHRSDASPFYAALERLLTVVEQDSELARLLEELPQALGIGLLLQTLFVRLFPQPPRPMVVDLTGQGRPQLGRREIEVLQEMAKGRSRKEIAEHLFISPSTVKKHLDNIYAKLEVDNSQEAVAKAAAFGLLSFDFADLIQPMRDRRELNFNPFAAVLLQSVRTGQEKGWTEPMNRLAAMGLMLFLLSPLTAHVRGSHVATSRFEEGQGVLFEFTPDGHLVRSFDGEGKLRHPIALTFAPPSAERHGFTKGNLFLEDVNDPNPINPTRLLELTPNGQYLRAFTSGAHLSTSLRGHGGIAFTPDGRLLAISGGFTDTLLEFTEGGRVIRRLATLVPAALTTDQRGNVYVAGGSSREQGVYVFNSQGDLLRTVGAVSAGDYIYDGMAVDDTGNLFVANNRDHVVEVYNASGHRLGIIKGGGLHRPHRLALSPDGNLYVLEFESQTVKVFHPSRRAFLFSFPALSGAQLSDLSFGPNGNLFAAGFWT